MISRRDIGVAVICISMVGFTLALISTYQYLIRYQPIDFDPHFVGSFLRPVVFALLITLDLARSNWLARWQYVALTLLQIPLMGDRSGGGITDSSFLTQIRVAEITYSGSILFDVSATLFLIAAALLVVRASRLVQKS